MTITKNDLIEHALKRPDQLIRLTLPNQKNSFDNYFKIKKEFCDFIVNEIDDNYWNTCTKQYRIQTIELILAEYWGQYISQMRGK